MNLLEELANLVHHQAKPVQRPAQYGPDYTYNPNPNTNIPYSTHNFQQFQNVNGHFTQGQGVTPIMYAPAPQFAGNSQGIGIQGLQNPGATPGQGGQFNRYLPIQNGYDQRIQF